MISNRFLLLLFFVVFEPFQISIDEEMKNLFFKFFVIFFLLYFIDSSGVLSAVVVAVVPLFDNDDLNFLFLSFKLFIVSSKSFLKNIN